MVIEREIYSKIKPVIKSAEAIIITGMRRTGKTTLLRFIWDTVKSENKLFLDLENPANQKYFEEKNYEKILDNLKFLGLSAKTKSYVFLDEIQFVRNIPSVIKYLIDHYGIKFFLSGSSSFYLKNLFSESLAGRKYIFELFPLSFREFLALKNPNLLLPKTDEKVSEAIFEEINRYYDEYLLYGGFPGVVRKESIEEKKMALEEIFSSYFQLEIRQLGDFRKIDVIRDLILLLMQRTGSKLDIQKLSKELGVARETIYHYLSFLEHTYFIALIRPWSRNRDTEIRSMPKFYLCDTGLINQFAKVSDGALFEN
ncbi:MAG TPA: ATP-binding protein, partial [Patescibacteria group bacterium]|nr:ATP-binding protein [Patescibacteria group bacterium]